MDESPAPGPLRSVAETLLHGVYSQTFLQLHTLGREVAMTPVFLLAAAISGVVVSGGTEIDYQPSPLQDADGRLLVVFERLTPPFQGFFG